MKLVSLEYSENLGREQEWVLEKLTLGDKNLIVGKNSAGKSRSISVLASLARALSNAQSTIVQSGKYSCEWVSSDGRIFDYSCIAEVGKVISERLKIDETIYLDRQSGGVGTILYEQVNGGQHLPFQAPENEFAISMRRDSLQHSFIEPLHKWASEVRYYLFGSQMGKEHMAIFMPNMPSVDDRDPNQIVGLMRNAVRDYGEQFVNAVIKDMQKLGYDIEGIDLGFPVSLMPQLVPPGLNSIRVKERGVRGYVDQVTMSQGMYRVLALLIHVNYLLLKKSSTCVIIDDIGEGLDFERSCLLISILREIADASSIQIIMSTNDRFVMNEVPLSEWTVLHRNGSVVSVSNYLNSKEKFDEFRFTGLSNFSFFEMDFLENNQSEEDQCAN